MLRICLRRRRNVRNYPREQNGRFAAAGLYPLIFKIKPRLCLWLAKINFQSYLMIWNESCMAGVSY